ncbi:MAG TPA: response regulator, partial [Terriglobales bacterium]|nr:response regulator [Terriglobales bacterium]
MATSNLAVLLVEDNPDDADLLQRSLADANAKVDIDWAETLSAGLALCAEKTFDLVLLDLSLPDSHGLPSVQRALEQAPQIPIVVLTGLDDEALGASAVHAGAQDFLIKGRMDGRTLARAMSYAVERHRLVADLEQSNAIKTYFAAT